jgi:hypothetical protein
MKKLAFFLIAVAIVYGLEFVREQNLSLPGSYSWSQDSNSAVRMAYDSRQSDVQVRGQGTVLRILPDDIDGSRHQRFILELDTGQDLLIAHNIDLAPRVTGLVKGETVEFYGEYEWNAKGGVIHWTHHDPNHRHIDGWLKHRGRTYQ